MTVRNIIEIDDAKCDGCGLCVPACEEGAIRIVDGKARVVSETYCDGLGACLGHCPRGAISIVQREAAPFDQAAVAGHLAAHKLESPSQPVRPARQCRGTAAVQLNVLGSLPVAGRPAAASPLDDPSPRVNSQLANWPVQLHLMPPTAPYLRGADLLLVADCAPVACADFHARFLDGRPVAIGCPKLDDVEAYVRRLSDIIRIAELRSITVVRMEVPCCMGLVRIAQAAVEQAGAAIPVHETIISIRGQVLAPSTVL
jgi:Pyruvate/2-oxoacid:ferredoxin oxidoreductase delta subunit